LIDEYLKHHQKKKRGRLTPKRNVPKDLAGLASLATQLLPSCGEPIPRVVVELASVLAPLLVALDQRVMQAQSLAHLKVLLAPRQCA